MKSKTKKSLGSKMNRTFMNTTGGGEAAEALNSSEIRMLGIIGEVAVTGVTGGFDTSTLTGKFKTKHTCTYIMPNSYSVILRKNMKLGAQHANNPRFEVPRLEMDISNSADSFAQEQMRNDEDVDQVFGLDSPTRVQTPRRPTPRIRK